jgi:hypothetical protein
MRGFCGSRTQRFDAVFEGYELSGRPFHRFSSGL